MGRLNSYWMFFYCCLLFSSGIVFGFIFTKSGEVDFVGFLNALASLATVGAAVTAIYALNSWRAQFKHAERYKVIKEFRDTVSDVDFVRRFVLFMRDSLLASLNGAESEDELENLPMMDFGMEMWWKHMESLNCAWKNMSELITDDEIALFSVAPNDINNSVTDLFSEMCDITFEDDLPPVKRHFKLVKTAANGGRKISAEYQELENGTRSLLKKLSS